MGRKSEKKKRSLRDDFTWFRRGLKQKFRKRKIRKKHVEVTNEKPIFLTSYTFILNRIVCRAKPRSETIDFIRQIFSSASNVVRKISVKKYSFRKKNFHEIFIRKISYLFRFLEIYSRNSFPRNINLFEFFLRNKFSFRIRSQL